MTSNFRITNKLSHESIHLLMHVYDNLYIKSPPCVTYSQPPPPPHTLQTSFSMTCNEVLPEWVSLKTDIWSFGTMLVKFFVGSRGPHSQREVSESELREMDVHVRTLWISVQHLHRMSSQQLQHHLSYVYVNTCIHNVENILNAMICTGASRSYLSGFTHYALLHMYISMHAFIGVLYRQHLYSHCSL